LKPNMKRRRRSAKKVALEDMTTAMMKDEAVVAGVGLKDVHSVAEGAEAEALAAAKATAAGDDITTATEKYI